MWPCRGARGAIWRGRAAAWSGALVLVAVLGAAALAPAAAAAGSGPPSVPRSPAVTSGDGTLTLKFGTPSSAGAGITGYVVTPTVDGVLAAERTYSGTATTLVVNGLTNTTSVALSVAAVGPGGRGPAATVGPIPVGLPAGPAFPTGTSGNGSATLSWWAAAPNGSPITGYVVTPYLGAAPLAARTFASPARSQVITGLTNGATYTFRVAAVNAAGTGPAISSPAVTVGLPAAPSSTSLASGDGSATVSWSAPSGNGNPITGYQVTPYLGTTALPTTTFASTATSQVVGGLANGSSYTFKVAAQNAVGTGPQATTAAITVGLPGSPPFPAAQPGNGTAKVSWWAASGNGSAITGYLVTPYIGSVAQTPRTFATTPTSQTITGLANGTTYTFKIAAVNAVGTGPAATASAITVGTPGAPTKVTAVAGAAGSGTATVSWTPAVGTWSAVTGYRVTPSSGTTALAAQSFDASATTRVLTGLPANASYTFKVVAVNAVGASVASSASPAVALAGGLPGAPTLTSATAGDGQALVQWTPPASTGALALTRYLVTPWVGATALAPTVVAPGATATTVTSLANGTSYRFTVAAANAVGTGPASASSPVVVPARLPSVPGTPSVVGYRGSVMLSWAAPASANGSPITGYVITPSIEGVDQAPIVVDDPATQHLVEGLAEATSYRFTVAARNAVGTGAASAASDPVVPMVAPSPTPGTIDVVGDSILFQASQGRLEDFAAQGQPAGTDALVFPYIGKGFHDVLPDERRRVAQVGRPSALVLALGTNDANPDNGGWTSSDLADYRAALHLPAPDACVVVVLPGLGPGASPGRVASEALARADMARVAADRPNTVVVDWQAVLDEHPGYVGPDGVHLAEDGELEGQHAAVTPADAYASTIWGGVAQCPPATIVGVQGFRSLDHPIGLAFDGSGRALVADSDGHRVLALEPGQDQQVVDFGTLAMPAGVAFGPDGSEYASDLGTARVLRRSPGGDVTVLPFAGLVSPAGLAVSTDGTVYVADMGAGQVFSLDAGGVQQTVPFTGLVSPASVALGPSGTLYVSDMGLHQVLVLDPMAGQSVVPFGTLQSPVGLAVAPDGTAVVADVAGGRVLALGPSGSLADVTPDGVSSPIWVALDPDGRTWVVDYGDSRVVAAHEVAVG